MSLVSRPLLFTAAVVLLPEPPLELPPELPPEPLPWLLPEVLFALLPMLLPDLSPVLLFKLLPELLFVLPSEIFTALPWAFCAVPEYSLLCVAVPALPSAVRLFRSWKAITAACVPSPYRPSTFPL